MLPYERANEDLQYGTGFAYNASGQWAAESGIGMLKAGKKTDPAQRFDDFPGEQPSKGEVERWCRAARGKLNDDMKAVLQGRVPAKLESETRPFDLSKIPALPSGQ